jgi:3-oxoacyl-[acyl-carrier-protein] synthase II
MEGRGVRLSDVTIVECGCLSALGENSESLWRNLLDGRCGFGAIQRFNTTNYVNHIAGCVAGLDAVAQGERFDVLVDRVIRQAENIPKDCMVITATTKGNIELLEMSQHAKVDYKPSCPLGDLVAEKWRLQDKGYNVNAACASSTMAMMLGAQAIKRGAVEAVVVFAADLVSEFVYSGFSALKALSPTSARPFDLDRDGLILGEAAGYVLLMSESRMRREKRMMLGKIR